MRPVILLGRPEGLKEDGWEEGTPESLKMEWSQYISNIATLSGMGEGTTIWPFWVANNMYLVPDESMWDERARELCNPEEAVDLAREQRKLDERFKWDDDPRNPLRAVAAVFAKYVEAERRKREEAVKLLVRR